MISANTRGKRTGRKIVVATAAIALLTAACASDGRPGVTVSKQTLGGGLGAAAGAAIGSTIGQGGGKTAAVIVGGLLGALVGSEFGRRLDDKDRRIAQATAQDALERFPSGSQATWNNPDTGVSGVVVPEPAFRNGGGEVCREYTQTITIDGRGETARGVACRNPDGTWQIVNS